MSVYSLLLKGRRHTWIERISADIFRHTPAEKLFIHWRLAYLHFTCSKKQTKASVHPLIRF